MDLNFASSQKDKFEKANVCVYVCTKCVMKTDQCILTYIISIRVAKKTLNRTPIKALQKSYNNLKNTREKLFGTGPKCCHNILLMLCIWRTKISLFVDCRCIVMKVFL